jgi:hypothetical protein
MQRTSTTVAALKREKSTNQHAWDSNPGRAVESCSSGAYKCHGSLPQPAARKGRRSGLQGRGGGRLARGCLKAAIVVTAVTTMYCGVERMRRGLCRRREKESESEGVWCRVGCRARQGSQVCKTSRSAKTRGPGALAGGRRPKATCKASEFWHLTVTQFTPHNLL